MPINIPSIFSSASLGGIIFKWLNYITGLYHNIDLVFEGYSMTSVKLATSVYLI